MTAIQSDTGNFPGGCTAKGPVKQNISFPADFTTSCVGNNNAAAMLMPDGKTLLQMQPLYRAEEGAPLVAWWHAGVPQTYPPAINITDGGALGAHGGTFVSLDPSDVLSRMLSLHPLTRDNISRTIHADRALSHACNNDDFIYCLI